MLNELKGIAQDTFDYLYKGVLLVKPLWTIITTVVYYVLFPHEIYVNPTIAVIVALFLDILSKYYSIVVINGGFRNSIKTRKLSSDKLWRGTIKKIVSVSIVLILSGLSYRVSFVHEVGIVFSGFVFSIIFWREAQSIIENLIDAGHEDLKWLLVKIKRKREEIEKSDQNHEEVK